MVKIVFFLMTLALSPFAMAKGHHFGFNVGAGLPYLTQGGLNYLHPSNKFSMEVAYGAFNLSIGSTKMNLTKTDLILKWHPFAGSFYLGVGAGQQSFSIETEKEVAGEIASISGDVKTTIITPQLGWMWGVADGGFFIGLDFGVQSPSNEDVSTSHKVSDAIAAHPDVEEAATEFNDQMEKYGKSSVPVFTMLRIGFLF